jgi:hypothetical protein
MTEMLNMMLVLKLLVSAYLDMPRAFPWFSCFIVCKLKGLYIAPFLLVSACAETSLLRLKWPYKIVVHSVVISLQTSVADLQYSQVISRPSNYSVKMLQGFICCQEYF